MARWSKLFYAHIDIPREIRNLPAFYRKAKQIGCTVIDGANFVPPAPAADYITRSQAHRAEVEILADIGF
jgi:hypothetical protein